MANITYTDSPATDDLTIGLSEGATEGNDRITIKAVGDGAATATVSRNNIFGYGGNDTLTIEVQNRSDDKSIVIDSNRMDGQDGRNQMVLKAGNKSDDTEINLNTLVSGNNNDRIKITAKSSQDASLSGNSLNAANGDNQFALETKSGSSSYSHIFTNKLVSGSGKDKFTLKAVASSGINSRAEILFNSIEAGDGPNQIQMTLQSNGPINFASNNEITSGQDADQITIISKSNSSSGIISSINRNSILSGDGDDKVKLQTQSKNGDATLEMNSIGVYGGDDKLDLIAKTNGNGDASIYENLFVNAGDDIIFKASVTSKVDAKFMKNTLLSNGDSEDFDIRSKAKGTAYADKNLISVYGADAVIKIRSEGETSNADFNTISSDGEGSEIEIISKAKGNADANSNRLEASPGDKITISAQGYSAYVGSNVALDVSNITLAANAKKGNAYVNYNVISAAPMSIGLFANIDVKSGGDAYVSGNTITGGTFDINSITVNAKGTATVEDNEVYHGKYQLLDISAKSPGSVIQNNLFDGGLGNSELMLDLDTGLGVSEIQTFITQNTFEGGTYGGMEAPTDTLSWKNSKQVVDFDAAAAGGNLIEIEHIAAGKKSVLTIDYDDVLAITEAENTLLITGKSSSLNIGGGWFNAGLMAFEGNDNYSTTLFTQGSASLYVQTGISVSYT